MAAAAQIGNAVPVVFGEALLRPLIPWLRGNRESC